MRILFLSQEYPPDTGWGGIGSYVKIICEALGKRGHEPHVLSCAPGQASSDAVIEGVEVHRRPVDQLPLPMRSRMPATCSRLDLARACHAYATELGPFDAAEVPDWMAEGLLLPKRTARRIVAHLHSPAPVMGRYERLGRDYAVAGRLERRAVRNADRITAPSTVMAKEARSIGWLAPHIPIEVIPLPVDVARWSPVAPVRASEPLVMATGRIERRKAPDVLVRAMALVRETVPDARLLLLGRSSGTKNGRPYREHVAGLAHDLGVDCEIRDAVARDELPLVLGAARVIAMPSRFETFGMAGAEGMAAGRPVVATTKCGLKDVLSPGSGTVVEPDDPRSLADALLPYLESAEVAMAAGNTARRAITAVCDPERIAERREAIYAD